MASILLIIFFAKILFTFTFCKFFHFQPTENENCAQELIEITQFCNTLSLFPQANQVSDFYLLYLENCINFKTLPYFPKSFTLTLPKLLYFKRNSIEIQSDDFNRFQIFIALPALMLRFPILVIKYA